ncbi:MAG TPA: SurA N-terminal domain-containing protein [Pyrinomonadaceae bacterium]|nr:SurA N-terminal domain-containing protein [Pyrinomonadaceae bacterium]
MSRLSKQLTLLSFGAVMIFALAACSSSGGTADTTVAATVNGKKIMMSEVERLVTQQAKGKQAQLSAHDLAQARMQVLDSLIQREVLFQRAEQEKLLPSEDEISAAINKQKQDSGTTDEEFARKLKEQNLTPEALREEAKKDIAIQKLQDKYAGKITISDREVEDYYNNNKQQFKNERGVALAMIAVDPADNSQQGITNDAKGDADAKVKIDDIYQQLKTGADFATVARAKSEDQSLLRGGDIGFATEDDLRQNGFPADLISQLFGPMQVGSITAPAKFGSPNSPGGRWYIFKLQEKRLQTENLTLESQGVRQQITVALTNQRKDILNAALVEVSMNEAKVVNNLAADMLNNPSNLGLRPATSQAATPENSAPASSPTPATKPSASVAKPVTTAKPATTPAKSASPR